MILKCAVFFALCVYTFAQAQAPWPCQAEIHKSEPNAVFIRVSDGVTNKMADTKVLPDISDLKGKDLESLVVIEILAGSDGDVRCARVQQGDPDLAQRSLNAAQKWHYKPYVVNDQRGTAIVDTWIRFGYKKDNVQVIVPSR
jgi:Gram-negative bacterial TonB protein C-terminal